MRPSRPRRLLTVLALTLAVVTFPLGALASHQFADVPDSNPFHNDIDAIADAGVTSGCGGGNYCPSANVTREQMAAFMNRLGALAPGKTPVVNADKLDGLDSSAFLQGTQITTSQAGPWFTSSGTATVAHPTTSERVTAAGAGTSVVNMRIVAPMELEGRVFGLSAIQICWSSGATNVILDSITVYDLHGSAESGISDGNDVNPTAGAGCWTGTPQAETIRVQGGMTVALTLLFSAAGQLDLSYVLLLWEPGVAPA